MKVDQCLSFSWFYVSHCGCLRSNTVKVALAAIGYFAFLFAFCYPISYEAHIRLIVVGSISIALSILGFGYKIRNECLTRKEDHPPKKRKETPPIVTPPPKRKSVDYSTMVASEDPKKRKIKYSPTPMRQPNFDSPAEYKSVDITSGWNPIEDPQSAFLQEF